VTIPTRPARTGAMDRKLNRKSRLRLAAIGIILFLVAGARLWDGNSFAGFSPRTSGGLMQLSLSDFSVTDGDTIRLNGARKGTRLVGFNTPETFRPRCDAGLELGNAATDRLKDLVQNSASIELEIIDCSCKPGTLDTEKCNFGRSCAYLRVDGRDVGDTLISEGLAASFSCGKTRCPTLPTPWCD
jgi:micrococcal nuclease